MLSVCLLTGPVADTCTLSMGAPDASVIVTVTEVGTMLCAGCCRLTGPGFFTGGVAGGVAGGCAGVCAGGCAGGSGVCANASVVITAATRQGNRARIHMIRL